MSRQINVFVIRHGQYNQETGHLTDEGREGVINAARRHLKDFGFLHAYHSGMPRTEETVREALGAIQNALNIPIRPHGLFGYAWLEALSPGYYAAAKARVAAGSPNTVGTWWEAAPPLRLAARAARGAIIGVAVEAADALGNNVLVGGHEWTAVAPTLEEKTPCLGYVGIIGYVVQISPGDTRIARWEFLR